MHLFLSDNTTTPYVTLLPDDSRHCVRVLRMAVGDELWVTSGDGTMCRAIITAPDDKGCEVEVVERITNYQPRPFHLHVAVAPTKNNARLEWFVEKAVEIGIDRITPLICDHSERGSLRTDRLEKLAMSAMKQSLKALRPVIDTPTPFASFIKQLGDSGEEIRLVCHCAEGERHTLHQLYTPGKDALVLIGPEGDFSQQEIDSAFLHGFQPVTLGDSRLRTETAALYATTVLNFMN